MVLASWSNDLAVVDPPTGAVRRLLPGVPAEHLLAADDRLLIGAWGKGLTFLPIGAIAQ